MKKIIILTLLSFALFSCAPKYDYVKTKFEHDVPPVKNVLLVLDYVSLKDDVGKLWDFDENYNLKQLDKNYAQLKTLIENKGYTVINKSLKASGLLMDSEYQAEHYVDKKLQDKLISPPFIIQATDLNDDEIQALLSLNYATRVHLGMQIMSKKKNSHYGLLTNNDNWHNLNLSDDTAIVVININHPKISAVKAMGIGVLSAAATGGYMYVTPYGIPSTFGYMLHPKTGDILWTNYQSTIRFSKTSKFFAQMPQATK